MARSRSQMMAAAWCGVMVLLLAGVQVVVDTPPPLFLFVVFSGVWVFGATMLWWFPRFGAVGTFAYGIILAVEVLRMHGVMASTLLVAVGSLVGSGLAAMVFAELRRKGGARA